ncbi:MAG: DUF4124 domain-containing protein [Parahaliea sp.]
MNRMIRSALLYGLGSLTLAGMVVAQTRVYQCRGEQGQAVFSQQPCGRDAVETTINSGGTNSTGTTSDQDRQAWQRIAGSNEVRDLRRDIARHQRRIGELKQERDLAMDHLREMGDVTSNTPPGMTYEEGLQPQLDQLADLYQGRMDSEQAKIGELQARIDDLLTPRE